MRRLGRSGRRRWRLRRAGGLRRVERRISRPMGSGRSFRRGSSRGQTGQGLVIGVLVNGHSIGTTRNRHGTDVQAENNDELPSAVQNGGDPEDQSPFSIPPLTTCSFCNSFTLLAETVRLYSPVGTGLKGHSRSGRTKPPAPPSPSPPIQARSVAHNRCVASQPRGPYRYMLSLEYDKSSEMSLSVLAEWLRG